MEEIEFFQKSDFLEHWQKFQKGIQSERIWAISKSVFQPFRIISKQSEKLLNLVQRKSVKNKSEKFRLCHHLDWKFSLD